MTGVGRDGWHRTWPDRDNDGVLWRGGYKVGRAYLFDEIGGRWQWFSWCGNCETGITATKDKAKVAVESRVDPARLSETAGRVFTPVPERGTDSRV